MIRKIERVIFNSTRSVEIRLQSLLVASTIPYNSTQYSTHFVIIFVFHRWHWILNNYLMFTTFNVSILLWPLFFLISSLFLSFLLSLLSACVIFILFCWERFMSVYLCSLNRLDVSCVTLSEKSKAKGKPSKFFQQIRLIVIFHFFSWLFDGQIYKAFNIFYN